MLGDAQHRSKVERRYRPKVERGYRWAAAACFGIVAACDTAPARSQWVVHVATDAPVPALGDRVRVDAIDAQGSVCPTCFQEFNVGAPSTLPFSFGVVPSAGVVALRFRLFRAENLDANGQPADVSIDYLAKLPSVGEGVTDIAAILSMRCFAVTADTGSMTSCDPSSGALAAAAALPPLGALPDVDGWSPPSAACDGAEAPSDRPICVHGGVYLLGSPTYLPSGPESDPVPEQLVHVPTFWLDRDELSVRAYRALVASGAVDKPQMAGADALCTWTDAPASNEDAPINCLTYDEAVGACKALGARLPSEAEWEWAAGNGPVQDAFPFAHASDTAAEVCASSVLACAPPASKGFRQCIDLDMSLPVGPRPFGNPSDKTRDGVLNLGGNVREWVADDHTAFTDNACWGESRALHENPVCHTGGVAAVVKGGSYFGLTYDAHPYYREAGMKAIGGPEVGVRCARDFSIP